MPLVKKDIFRAGTYRLPDGRDVTYTPADVRNAFVQGRRMLADGLAVPVIFEHDIDAVPVPLSYAGATPDWPASFARNTIGSVEGYELRDGVLWSVNDIPNEADAKRWKVCKFASPRIDRNLQAQNGKSYPGVSVSHLAVTPKPIQYEQLPVMLSRGGRQPELPVFLSLSYRSDDMADDNDDKSKGGDKGKGAGSADGGAGGMKKVLDSLAKLGFVIPDSVTDMDSLGMALEVLAANPGAGKTAAVGDDDDFDDDPATSANTSVGDGGGTPVMMSAQVKAAEGKVFAGIKRDLQARAEKVTRVLVSRGVMDGPTARDLIRKIGGENLSLTPTGDAVRTATIIELETYENVARRLKGKGGTGGGGNGGGNSDFLSTTTTAAKIPALGPDDPEKLKKIEEAKQLALSRIPGGVGLRK